MEFDIKGKSPAATEIRAWRRAIAGKLDRALAGQAQARDTQAALPALAASGLAAGGRLCAAGQDPVLVHAGQVASAGAAVIALCALLLLAVHGLLPAARHPGILLARGHRQLRFLAAGFALAAATLLLISVLLFPALASLLLLPFEAVRRWLCGGLRASGAATGLPETLIMFAPLAGRSATRPPPGRGRIPAGARVPPPGAGS